MIFLRVAILWFHSNFFLLFFSIFFFFSSLAYTVNRIYVFVCEPSIQTISIVLIRTYVYTRTHIVHIHICGVCVCMCQVCSTNLTLNAMVVIFWHHRIYAYLNNWVNFVKSIVIAKTQCERKRMKWVKHMDRRKSCHYSYNYVILFSVERHLAVEHCIKGKLLLITFYYRKLFVWWFIHVVQ